MQIKGVAETVEARLRKEIMTGAIGPGERVNEISVSERYGVSRPPLREALRRLENENLIISIPRRGSFVAELSRADCLQIYRARIMIECGALDIIKENGGCDTEVLGRVLAEEKRLTRSRAGAAKRDPHGDYLIMSKFHNALVEICGNSWLIHFHRQLRPTMGRYQIMYLMIPGQSMHSLEEHDEVFDLLCRQQYDDAQKSLRTHIERTLDVLRDKVPR